MSDVLIDFQDGVNDFVVGLMKVYFSLLYAQWHI